MVSRALLGGILAGLLALPPGMAQGADLPDANARPLRPPMPSYPLEAMKAGITGYCDVHFNVDTRGEPGNVRPLCSHRVFCDNAATTIEAIRFMPARRDGQIIVSENIMYPLEYRIEGVPYFERDATALEECIDPLIS